VLSILLDLVLLFQPEATGGGGGDGGGGAGSPASGCATQGGLILVMMVLFYFMLIRPQQKRQKEHDQMLKSLRKGVKVRTTGGILGEIVEIDDREAVLLIADKTKINVLRAHIANAETPPAEKKAEEKKKDDENKKEKD
jgi:preprotein translocase subunit YajC